MSKSTRYLVYAKLSSYGEVEGTQCDCTAGYTGDAHCKHVIVLLLAIADVKKSGTFISELSCTQQLQTFHKPRGKFKGTPLKVSVMKKKSTTKKKSEEETSSSQNDQKDKDSNYVTWFRNHVVNVGFNLTMPMKCINPPANPYAVISDHTYSSMSVTDSLIKALKLEEITSEEISDIEMKTRGQADNDVWHLSREGRLTASKFFSFVHGSGKSSLAHSSLYPSRFASEATNHGIKYEPVAVKTYIEKYGITAEEVQECGLFILGSHPFIAGSPDSLLSTDGVIEVKCPYTTRKEEVSPDHHIFLEMSNDGDLKLKEAHQYYYQVQGQLLVTGRSFCDFVVWTFKGCERIKVPRNEAFIDLLFCDLYNFYSNYMKPAVINKYIYRDFNKCGFHDLGFCAKN